MSQTERNDSMREYTERLYTVVDKETLNLFNSKRVKEGVHTYSEYLRLIVERYVNDEPETKKLVSRDRVSQNYQDLYAEIVSQSEEIKLLTSVILILAAQQSRNTDNPLTEQSVSEALHRATALMKDNDEIGPAAVEKMMRDILRNVKPSTMQVENTPVVREAVTVQKPVQEFSYSLPEEKADVKTDDNGNDEININDFFDPNILTVSNFNHKLFKKDVTKNWWRKIYEGGQDEDSIDSNTKRAVVFFETAEDSQAGKQMIDEGYDAGPLGLEWIKGLNAIRDELIYQTTGEKQPVFGTPVNIKDFLNRWSDVEGRCILPKDAEENQ